MITLGKQGTLAARRRAISTLRNEDAVRELFSKVAPAFNDRKGGYTRIFKLGRRSSDSSEMALLEFVDYILPVKADPEAKDTKPAKKTAPRKKAAAAADKAEEAPFRLFVNKARFACLVFFPGMETHPK